MKQLFLCVIGLIFCSTILSAQDTIIIINGEDISPSPYASGQIPFPKYKALKSQYNYKNYMPMVGDAYSPGWSGTASFFIPGLGQIICGETGRGLAFLGGQVLAGGVLCGMALRAWDVNFGYVIRGRYGFSNFQDETWLVIAGIGAAVAVGLDIWSSIDAVRIAKVKNMYLQDVRGQYAFDMKMFPSLNYVGGTYAPGLTLAVSF